MIAAASVEQSKADLPVRIRRAVAVLWRLGSDTLTISETFDLPEADVCRIVAADQDRRHAARHRAGLA